MSRGTIIAISVGCAILGAALAIGTLALVIVSKGSIDGVSFWQEVVNIGTKHLEKGSEVIDDVAQAIVLVPSRITYHSNFKFEWCFKGYTLSRWLYYITKFVPLHQISHKSLSKMISFISFILYFSIGSMNNA